MRKLIVVLIVVFSFALGMFSQNLIAGNWVTPKYGTPAPEAELIGNKIIQGRGNALYQVPDDWKVIGLIKKGDPTTFSVKFQKLE